jgi:aerobic carbon-monoxide dehydrogenase medium subunit
MPDHIIDINKIAALSYIRHEADMLAFGAMTRQRDIEFNDDVARLCPIIREALLQVGHRQTRNRGTLGGSLCHLDPAAEMPAVMMLHDANLHAAGPSGRARTMPMSNFALGYMTSALAPDELLTRVDAPLWPAGHGYAWREFARRHGDFALASAGVLLTLDNKGDIDRLSVVIAGLGPTPARLSDFETSAHGAQVNDDLVAAAASAAKSIEAMDDIHGSAAYRQHLAGVLVARALRAAAERARERTAAHV